MKKWWVALALFSCVTVIGIMFIALLSLRRDEEIQAIPSPEALYLVRDTFTPSVSSATLMPSPTPTPTITFSPTATATLATRVAVVRLIMPEVSLPPSTTPFPDNLQILSAPPHPVEPLPDATLLPFPYEAFTDWVSFESDHPAMRYLEGGWRPLQSERASQGQYHFTEDASAKVRFTFTGEAVRVRYVGFTNGGVWHVLLDGERVDTIDSYAPSGLFTGTRVYTAEAGEHTLELQNTENANAASSGHMLALDAVQVYHPDALTMIVPDGMLPTDIPTATWIPARNIELIAAPPSPQPTATDIPVQVVSASLLIGYDENANGVMDVSEGVSGISVRLVEVATNRVLTQAFTDERGFVELQASTNSAALLVVPYFGQSWSARAGSPQLFTLLLSPGNQPGLIP